MSDLIERKSIRSLYSCLDSEDKVRVAQVLIDIDAIPTIDAVEVVRGEWIEYRPPTEDYCGMVECPFCGEELVGEPTDFNYCPNCGARMKGADDEY